MSGGMSTREASIFACLVDTLLAPESPLPPVAETNAVESFGVWMSRFPAGGRIGMRAVLVIIELLPRVLGRRRLPWHALPPAERLQWITRFERGMPSGSSVLDGLRAAAGASYYGDPLVSVVLGYTPPEGLNDAR